MEEQQQSFAYLRLDQLQQDNWYDISSRATHQQYHHAGENVSTGQRDFGMVIQYST